MRHICGTYMVSKNCGSSLQGLSKPSTERPQLTGTLALASVPLSTKVTATKLEQAIAT